MRVGPSIELPELPRCDQGPIGRLRWTLHEIASLVKGGSVATKAERSKAES